ncbi:hypothetical protein E4U58_005080 [Claviceps cyperi]|nr:hypothetical protein E4U58_005080 [Claviceps cyperi]
MRESDIDDALSAFDGLAITRTTADAASPFVQSLLHPLASVMADTTGTVGPPLQLEPRCLNTFTPGPRDASLSWHPVYGRVSAEEWPPPLPRRPGALPWRAAIWDDNAAIWVAKSVAVDTAWTPPMTVSPSRSMRGAGRAGAGAGAGAYIDVHNPRPPTSPPRSPRYRPRLPLSKATRPDAAVKVVATPRPTLVRTRQLSPLPSGNNASPADVASAATPTRRTGGPTASTGTSSRHRRFPAHAGITSTTSPPHREMLSL